MQRREEERTLRLRLMSIRVGSTAVEVQENSPCTTLTSSSPSLSSRLGISTWIAPSWSSLPHKKLVRRSIETYASTREEKTIGRTARGKPRREKRVMAGKTMSDVRGLPLMVEKRANEEKATAKGVKDQRKFEDDER